MGYVREWLFRIWDKSNCLFGNIAITAFVVVQCLDGIFTYIGVNRGLAPEGNPLARRLMSIVGVGLGVIVFKVVAVGLGSLLYLWGRYNVLATLTAFYVIFILSPWVYLFLTR